MYKKILYLLAIIGITLLVYANSIPNEFVWDDNHLILKNPDVKDFSLKTVATLFTHDIFFRTDKSNFYRPLQMLSYMVDYRLWGGSPFGFHFINASIHAINGVLIFLLLLLFFRNDLACFISALFFAVHPLQTSAVSYIAGRADLFGLMFLLISTYFIFTYLKSANIVKGLAAILAFALALISKEANIVFPLFAVLFVKEFKVDGESAADEKPLVWGLFAVAVVYVILRLTILKFGALASQAINDPGLYRRALLLPPVFLTYLRLLILPYDLRMDRDFKVPASLSDPEVILSIAAIAALAYLFKRFWAKEKTLVLGLGWYLILLFPSLNIMLPLNAPISEHWLYVPFFGISIAIAYLISGVLEASKKSFRSYKPVFVSVCFIALAFYAGTTIYVNQFWKNEEKLFSYIVRFQKVHPRAHVNLGYQYINTGRYKDAAYEFREALKRDNQYFEALIGMAISSAHLKQYEVALKAFDGAVKINPDSSAAYSDFAKSLLATGKDDEAARLYKKAIELDVKNLSAYNGLGIAYANKKLYKEAREVWDKGLSIDPKFDAIRQNMARLPVVAKQVEVQAHLDSVNALASQGKYAEAIVECKKALALDPKNISGHNNLGVLYAMTGSDENAALEFIKVVELDPNEFGAYKNIAIIYSKYPPKYPQAIEYFQKYLKYSTSEEERAIILKKIEEMQGLKEVK